MTEVLVTIKELKLSNNTALVLSKEQATFSCVGKSPTKYTKLRKIKKKLFKNKIKKLLLTPIWLSSKELRLLIP